MLLEFRDDDELFSRLYRQASDTYGEEIPMPRLAPRQRNRPNVPADDPQEYFKRAMFLPFLDTCVGQLQSRFEDHASKANKLPFILPAHLEDARFEDVQDAAHLYEKFLPGDSLEMEFRRWKAHWLRLPMRERPHRLSDACKAAERLGTYPAVHLLLHIFATLPVTTATGERSFSALKYIKNYLRSTMKEVRMNGLAHMFINRDIKLNYDVIIDMFSKKNRRLEF